MVTHRGTFCFVRMPFGHKNAPSVFQGMMDYVLRDLLFKVCFVFMDDVIVYGKSYEELIENTRLVV